MPRKRKTRAESPDPERQPKDQSGDQPDDVQEAAPPLPPPPPPPPPFTELSLGQVHRLIEPGPVLLVSTGCAADQSHNLMTMGFHMMLQHSGPTLIGLCIGPWDATFAVLRAQRQCVLAVPSVEMAEAVVDIGNCSSEDGGGADSGGGRLDKWSRFGLQPLPAQAVLPPLVGGPNIMANIECVVHDDRMVGRHSLWVVKAVRAWWNEDKVQHTGRMLHHRGNGVFAVSGETVVDLHERMTKWPELA